MWRRSGAAGISEPSGTLSWALSFVSTICQGSTVCDSES